MNTSSNEFDIFSFESPAKALSLLPKRQPRSNKGDYGRVLCICGSSGMAGAAYLAAKAAYRMGAGLVEIFTHESNRVILQTALPEAIVSVYTDEYSADDLIPSLKRASCIVAGCGLGVTPLSRQILSDLLINNDIKNTPLVLDADGLNILSKNPSLLKYAKGAVMTPHPAEMSRLTGCTVESILDNTAKEACKYAKAHSVICLLKDHRTVVSDGSTRIYRNLTGNSGMATGGSGDVLSGIIGGILAQLGNVSSDIFTLTALGAYIHGRSGDLAAKDLGEYSLMAGDIIEYIPKALKLL